MGTNTSVNDTSITEQKHYSVHVLDYIMVAYQILRNTILRKLCYSDLKLFFACSSLEQKEMIQTEGMCEANEPQLAFTFDLIL